MFAPLAFRGVTLQAEGLDASGVGADVSVVSVVLFGGALLASHELALTVVHATQPTPTQQGVGFDHAFEWDVPLTEGYRSMIVRPPHEKDRIDSGSLTGLDVPEIGQLTARCIGELGLRPGDTVKLRPDPARIHRFDQDGKALG